MTIDSRLLRPATDPWLHWRRAPWLGALLLTLAVASRGDAVPGDLAQFVPCIRQAAAAASACADGVGLQGALSVAVSPDGKHVYVASQTSDALAVFTRDKTTGALTQLPGLAACVSNLSGACADGVGLNGAQSVAVSPDGKHVYVASQTSDALAVFTRDKTTGALAQLPGLAACVSNLSGACADGVGLAGASSVTVSPDGKHVYVASQTSDAVAVFTRDKTTGALTQLAGEDACVSDVYCGPGRAA